MNKKSRQFMQELNKRFPSFQGGPIDDYTFKTSLINHLIRSGIDPDAIETSNMIADATDRSFSATITPKPGNCLLQITHIGVDVKGVKQGHLFTVQQICEHLSKGGQRVDPAQFKSVTPVDENGQSFIEMTVPCIVSMPMSKQEALNMLAEMTHPVSAHSDEIEDLVHAMQQALVAKIRMLQKEGKSLVEIEKLCEPIRAEVKAAEDAYLAEVAERNAKIMNQSRQSAAETIVNPDAILISREPVTAQEIMDRVKAFADRVQQASTEPRSMGSAAISPVPRITLTDLYGTAPGQDPERAHDRLSDMDATVGQAVEQALLDAGWYGVSEQAPGTDQFWTVWTRPVSKG